MIAVSCIKCNDKHFNPKKNHKNTIPYFHFAQPKSMALHIMHIGPKLHYSPIYVTPILYSICASE